MRIRSLPLGLFPLSLWTCCLCLDCSASFLFCTGLTLTYSSDFSLAVGCSRKSFLTLQAVISILLKCLAGTRRLHSHWSTVFFIDFLGFSKYTIYFLQIIMVLYEPVLLFLSCLVLSRFVSHLQYHCINHVASSQRLASAGSGPHSLFSFLIYVFTILGLMLHFCINLETAC